MSRFSEDPFVAAHEPRFGGAWEFNDPIALPQDRCGHRDQARFEDTPLQRHSAAEPSLLSMGHGRSKELDREGPLRGVDPIHDVRPGLGDGSGALGEVAEAEGERR
ncbi:hypothetical protein GCM10009841_22540 [Microlunatus panaciterrae]